MGVESLVADLAKYETICVDTMVFIYLLDTNSEYVDLASSVLGMIESGEAKGVTSTITIAEILTAPAQANDIQAMLDYELYLTNFPNLTFYSPDKSLARLIARTRAESRLKLPGAIQVATAIYAGADVIVSNDKKWQNKFAIPKLLLLKDYLPKSDDTKQVERSPNAN